MKICMLAPEFIPVWGGVGTYIGELVRHLPKDIEVHVVTHNARISVKEKFPTLITHNTLIKKILLSILFLAQRTPFFTMVHFNMLALDMFQN